MHYAGEILLILKGAPESVLRRCSAYEHGEERKPLDGGNDEARATYVQMYRELSAQGYRVLAVAYRPVSKLDTYRKTEEQDLVLLGFLTFADPPKADVAQVLQALKKDGVHVKIMTGDNELVTQHVCEQVGLATSRIVLGSELERMTDPALARIVEEVNVFARVSPAQKNRIILALKSHKHVVGYIGDGINDAPRCMRRMWVSQSLRASMWPRMRQILSFSNRACRCYTMAFWRGAKPLVM